MFGSTSFDFFRSNQKNHQYVVYFYKFSNFILIKLTNFFLQQKDFYIPPAKRREIVEALQSIIVFHDMDRGPAHIQDKQKPFQ